MNRSISDAYAKLSRQEFLDDASLYLRLTGDFELLDTSVLSARLFGASREDLLGKRIEDLLDLYETKSWMPWLSVDNLASLLADLFSRANKHGVSHRQISLCTGGQMVYPAIINCYYLENQDEYIFFGMIWDPYVGRENSDGPLYIDANGNMQSTREGTLSQEELKLLKDYCQVKTVAQLALKYNVSRKNMEHRLSRIANEFNFDSITEMVKFCSGEYLAFLPCPDSVLTTEAQVPIADHARYRYYRKEQLPSQKFYLEQITSRTAGIHQFEAIRRDRTKK